MIRDVQNRLFYFGSVFQKKNSDSIRIEIVRFKKMRFCLDIIVKTKQ